MDIIDRLQKIIDHEGLTISAFSRKIGVGDQTIRGIVVQRRNKPGFELIARIIQTFNWLNAEWFITGEGEMIKSNMPNETKSSPSLAELIQYLREKDMKIEQLIEEKTELKVKYEMVNRIADGKKE